MENEIGREIHFYKLNKMKRYSIEGSVSRSFNYLIPFSIFFLISDIVIFVIGGYNAFKELIPILLGIGFLLAGFITLGLGIYEEIKRRRLHQFENKIMKNCTLTDGKIIQYQCKEIRSHHQDHIDIHYEVQMTYCFYDKDFRYREAQYYSIYNQDPCFFQGQYLMIAFDKDNSLILNSFVLSKEDQKKLLQAEASRLEDKFVDVTGKLERIDIKKYKSGENIIIHFVVAIVAFVWMLFYGLLIGFLSLKHVIETQWVEVIILTIVIALVIPLAVFSIPFVWGIGTAISRIKRYKLVFKEKPVYYTYGKLFSSRKTYTLKEGKKILYYFIDHTGTSHIDECKSHLRTQDMKDEFQRVVVAYNDKG
ncbi:MAG: hypothetical protein K2J85_05960, partial [Anaeroplasmataceae bacterium]|nr:hypothetical protein [Anaeroplasmataceae bacterium]